MKNGASICGTRATSEGGERGDPRRIVVVVVYYKYNSTRGGQKTGHQT